MTLPKPKNALLRHNVPEHNVRVIGPRDERANAVERQSGDWSGVAVESREGTFVRVGVPV